MSTSTEPVATLNTPADRRFYPRVTPSAPLCLDPADNSHGVLLNVSENGLLLSTPVAPTLNSVSRISLPLTDIPYPIQVLARVIWTDSSANLAGIQLLDLCDDDREQIRRWLTLESPRTSPQKINPIPVAAAAALMPLAPAQQVQSLKKLELVAPPIVPAPVSAASAPTIPSLALRKRSISAPAIALWCLAIGTLGFAAVVFSRVVVKPTLSAPSAPRALDPVPAQPTPVPPASPQPSPDSPSSKISTVALSAPVATTSPSALATHARTQIAIAQSHSASSLQDARVAVASQNTNAPSPLSEPSESIVKNEESPTVDSTPANSQPLLSQHFVPTPPPSTSTLSNFSPQPSPKPPAPNPPPANIISPSAHPPAPAVQPAAQPSIQTDSSTRSTIEIRSPSGFYPSVLALPGQQVLESSSLTTRIQRSILLPPARWGLFRRKEKVVVGELLSRVDPQTPRREPPSRSFVRVNAIIARDGHVQRVQPLSGPALLVPSVLSAIRQWRFQPTLAGGKPVETSCLIEMQFHNAR